MHEFSITEHLLSVVLEHARKARAHRVSHVDLVNGDLTGVVDESLRFYFDLLSKGTPAEKASLSVSRVPVRAACERCQEAFTPEGTSWQCPRCGAGIQEILEGRELYVKSIDVE